jgi:SCY1-like protein 1
LIAHRFASLLILLFFYKLAQNEMQSAMSAAAGAAIERALSAPASEDNSKSLPGGFPSGSTQLSGGLRSALPTQTSFTLGSTSTSTINGGTIPKSKSKGMQLGASKVPQGSLAEEWAEEAAAEVGLGVNASGENPWGGDDLMDINADDDDWSTSTFVFFLLSC